MRKCDQDNARSEWNGDTLRRRDDAVDYVPNCCSEKFELLLTRSSRRVRRNRAEISLAKDTKKEGKS